MPGNLALLNSGHYRHYNFWDNIDIIFFMRKQTRHENTHYLLGMQSINTERASLILVHTILGNGEKSQITENKPFLNLCASQFHPLWTYGQNTTTMKQKGNRIFIYFIIIIY